MLRLGEHFVRRRPMLSFRALLYALPPPQSAAEQDARGASFGYKAERRRGTKCFRSASRIGRAESDRHGILT